MRRLVIIDIAGVNMRLLRRRQGLWLNTLASPPRAMRASFPAVRTSVQASMTTGVTPGVHGVISGGLFRRQRRQVSLAEKSNTLLNQKRFWLGKHLPRRLKAAMLFWSNPLAGAADFVVGAATYSLSEGQPPDTPRGLYAELAGELGTFDPAMLRGPAANWRSCEWITSAAHSVWVRHKPDIMLVYLPGVNFEAVRHGLDSPQVDEALDGVDRLAREFAGAVCDGGGEVMVVSDGGHVPVSRVIKPNLLLHRAGLLKLVQTGEGSQVDLDGSRAFALVDHQVAQLYCVDETAVRDAAAAIGADPAVAAIRSRDELLEGGLGHDRAGECIALAAPDAWFSHQWWDSPEEAPASVLRGGEDGRCGYDPCELFAGKLPGMIDPDPLRVRASRGLTDIDGDDQCFFAATCATPTLDNPRDIDVPKIAVQIMAAQAHIPQPPLELRPRL